MDKAKELKALLSYGSEEMIIGNKTRALSAINTMMNSLNELKLFVDEVSVEKKTVLYEKNVQATDNAVQNYLNPFELKETGRGYDFIATVQNNTDSVLKFKFDEDLGIDDFEIAPNDWVGLLADATGRETYRAIENEEYELEIVEVKPQLDEVIKSCADKVEKAPVTDVKDVDLDIE